MFHINFDTSLTDNYNYNAKCDGKKVVKSIEAMSQIMLNDLQTFFILLVIEGHPLPRLLKVNINQSIELIYSYMFSSIKGCLPSNGVFFSPREIWRQDYT